MKIPGMVKCGGPACPNGGMTSLFSEDTVTIGKRHYCSSCRPDWRKADRRSEAVVAREEVRRGAKG